MVLEVTIINELL